MTESIAQRAAAKCRDNQERALSAHQVMFCARCGHATGGFYGHYTSACNRTDGPTEHHLCCPGSCALTDGPEMDRTAPCHPAPGTYDQWADEIERVREEKRS